MSHVIGMVVLWQRLSVKVGAKLRVLVGDGVAQLVKQEPERGFLCFGVVHKEPYVVVVVPGPKCVRRMRRGVGVGLTPHLRQVYTVKDLDLCGYVNERVELLECPTVGCPWIRAWMHFNRHMIETCYPAITIGGLMESDADVDLTELLTEDEVLMLDHNKLDPDNYCPVFIMGDLRVSEPDAQGGRVVISQGYLPPGIVKAASSLLTPDGTSVNPFDGAIALPPSIRLIVRKDRIIGEFLAGLVNIVKQRSYTPDSADANGGLHGAVK